MKYILDIEADNLLEWKSMQRFELLHRSCGVLIL